MLAEHIVSSQILGVCATATPRTEGWRLWKRLPHSLAQKSIDRREMSFMGLNERKLRSRDRQCLVEIVRRVEQSENPRNKEAQLIQQSGVYRILTLSTKK